MESRLLTLSEAQELLSLSRSTVYALVRAGELEAVKVGRALRIPADAVAAFISRLRTEQAEPPGSEVWR